MPEQFDEEWEYYSPDPEILELIESDRIYSITNLPLSQGDNGKSQIDGFSVSSKPYAFTRLSINKEKYCYQEREHKYYPPRNCMNRKCGYMFNPKTERNLFCCRDCYLEFRNATQKVYTIICHNLNCHKEFKTLESKRKYCSRRCSIEVTTFTRCSMEEYRINRFNPEKQLDEKNNTNSSREIRSEDGKLKGSLVDNHTKICENKRCQKVYQCKRIQQKYCCLECRPGRPKLALAIPCTLCGVVFKRDRLSRKFCSHKCWINYCELNRKRAQK